MAKKNGNGQTSKGARKKNSGANGNGGERTNGQKRQAPREPWLNPDTKNSILGISFMCIAIILTLAGFSLAGPAGTQIYQGLSDLFGWGYFILPGTLIFAALVFLLARQKRLVTATLLGSVLLILSFLGLIEVLSPGHGGWLGLIFGSFRTPFGTIAATVIDIFLFIIAVLVTANVPLKIKFPEPSEEDEYEDADELVVTGTENDSEEQEKKEKSKDKKKAKDEEKEEEAIEIVHAKDDKDAMAAAAKNKKIVPVFSNYVPPPLSLLKSESGKPTTGDLLANANIIKRTLESFGIAVEMGEINVGPAVTRYTLKPAEGVKLSRITALNPDLALALAAHPVRIEAPIPGKSLVGIEVPNKAAALVRLGSLMHYPEFMGSGPLGFVLGRDVSGEPVFANIEKMPHLLVAGATGSGKSILVHSLITSLLFKNSPQTLKLALIDPKRVELSLYDGIPHLITPVITENKKALGVLRWAIQEMDRRYQLLQQAGSRDIKSYNANHKGEEALPYILIGIDEMADLMSSFGREVEGAIVRLAQMARATGIHLLLATQRPSVEVITGLIKANIPARVALQVASQIDSRTILDTAGAEKLLGHGDLLFLSAELSKPKRIQGPYITEEELKGVVTFIKDNNKVEIVETEESDAIEKGGPITPQANFPANLDALGGDEGGEEDDELFDEALATVAEAKKASASLLQRRLKVGYARAARLLDLMESGGYIGPGEGAKPRDVNIEKIEERLS